MLLNQLFHKNINKYIFLYNVNINCRNKQRHLYYLLLFKKKIKNFLEEKKFF